MPSLLIDGWHQKARQLESPNQDEFPAGRGLELVVIHGISLPAGQFDTGEIERLFTNSSSLAEASDLRVSAHFLVGRSGALTQFVSCSKRAWHAGESSWRGLPGCNDYALGIELEGTNTQDYEPLQYERLAALLGVLFEGYPTIAAVAGHCHVAPLRKSDPGTAFNWDKLFALIGPQYDGRN